VAGALEGLTAGSVAEYADAMLELPETLPLRVFRLEAGYSAARLGAQDDTRPLSRDFEEAADKFALLEAEEARIDVQRMETQAMVETADDAWDDTMRALQRRLLELSGNSCDHELYRKYFSDIPSQVTSLSYHAEIMISKDLERALQHEEIEELRVFSDKLHERREPLENLLLERTRLEVETARFQNRTALAKAILNKLRRVAYASLEEMALARGLSREWCVRFFHERNIYLEALEQDGTETNGEKSINGEASLSEAPTASA
jgi:hypothetical protein